MSVCICALERQSPTEAGRQAGGQTDNGHAVYTPTCVTHVHYNVSNSPFGPTGVTFYNVLHSMRTYLIIYILAGKKQHAGQGQWG